MRRAGGWGGVGQNGLCGMNMMRFAREICILVDDMEQAIELLALIGRARPVWSFENHFSIHSDVHARVQFGPSMIGEMLAVQNLCLSLCLTKQSLGW